MNGFYVPDQMYLEDFGGEQIFRPRLPTELAVRAEAEIHLRSSSKKIARKQVPTKSSVGARQLTNAVQCARFHSNFARHEDSSKPYCSGYRHPVSEHGDVFYRRHALCQRCGDDG